jgi:tRNA uracil 4-sulfurtransferase
MEKGLLLISGGIDSPVAGHLIKNKLELKAIHFSQTPFTNNTPELKSIECCKKLNINELIVVEVGEELNEIVKCTYSEYYFVLLKILFLKISEKIAKKEKINYLITGESLGQVSSQTLSNLNNINSKIEMHILRPCLFMNKQEIIDISMKENFFEISKGPEMCDVLAQGKPKTKTKLTKINQELEKCNIYEMVENSLKKIRIEKIN